MGAITGKAGKFGVGCAVVAFGLTAMASSARAADKVDYTSQIKPLLKESCVKCHSLDNPRKQASAGLRLDDKDLALKGGKHAGKAIVPGKAEDSLVYKLLLGPVEVDGKKIDAMPKSAQRGTPPKKLTEEQVTLVKNWIDQGAKFE